MSDEAQDTIFIEGVGELSFAVVDEIPAATRAGSGIYQHILGYVPDYPKALSLPFDDAKVAGTRVNGMRGYLQRHSLKDKYRVARQGNVIFVARREEGDTEEEVDKD